MLIRFVVAPLLVLSICMEPAFGYIDPVTGSFVIQGLAAAVVGALVAFKSARDRVLSFFGRGKQAKPEIDAADATPNNEDAGK